MDEKISALIKSRDDLVTPYEMTRAGFISMALEKNLLATPYIEEAKALKALAAQVDSSLKLINVKELRVALITASGLSEKALAYLSEEDKDIAIQGLIDKFLEPAGQNFPDELVYRFLLTKGDALGGKARNLAGLLGERKFLRMFVSILSITGKQYKWKDKISNTWILGDTEENDIEKRIKAIYWMSLSSDRLLVLNANVPLVNKKVDLVLLKSSIEDFYTYENPSLNVPERYLALGELKGGIDPAGADEHWKTANSALQRIHSSFNKINKNPYRFFIGSAIEKAMAAEIFNQLHKRELDYAVNLTNDDQLAAICSWLLQL